MPDAKSIILALLAGGLMAATAHGQQAPFVPVEFAGFDVKCPVDNGGVLEAASTSSQGTIQRLWVSYVRDKPALLSVTARGTDTRSGTKDVLFFDLAGPMSSAEKLSVADFLRKAGELKRGCNIAYEVRMRQELMRDVTRRILGE